MVSKKHLTCAWQEGKVDLKRPYDLEIKQPQIEKKSTDRKKISIRARYANHARKQNARPLVPWEKKTVCLAGAFREEEDDQGRQRKRPCL